MLDSVQSLSENDIQEVNGGVNTGYTGPCFVYVIKQGDCLSVLAQRYHTTVATLVALNNIADPNKIYTGNKLLIPYIQ